MGSSTQKPPDKMFKVFIIALIVNCAVSLPQYKGVVPVVEKELPPQPYTYQYGVADDYSKVNFQKAESQDGSGNVQGEYTIALPDGRIQHTKYTADPVNGYIADVTYEGTLSTLQSLQVDMET